MRRDENLKDNGQDESVDQRESLPSKLVWARKAVRRVDDIARLRRQRA